MSFDCLDYVFSTDRGRTLWKKVLDVWIRGQGLREISKRDLPLTEDAIWRLLLRSVITPAATRRVV